MEIVLAKRKLSFVKMGSHEFGETPTASLLNNLFNIYFGKCLDIYVSTFRIFLREILGRPVWNTKFSTKFSIGTGRSNL